MRGELPNEILPGDHKNQRLANHSPQAKKGFYILKWLYKYLHKAYNPYDLWSFEKSLLIPDINIVFHNYRTVTISNSSNSVLESANKINEIVHLRDSV